MNRIYYIAFSFVILASCKNDKKASDESAILNDSINEIIDNMESKSFDDKLLDFRDVNKEIASGFVVNQFGMEKINDSVFGFVFKLNNEVSTETINKYSLGIRGFDSNSVKPFHESFTPELELIEGSKYLVLKRKILNTRYFDSIDVYIYERKNWEKSGRLGGVMIRDILFE